MTAEKTEQNPSNQVGRAPSPPRGFFYNIKLFVLCHGILQLAQLLVSGYLKASISTIERRYGFTSQKSGLLAAFNEVGNTVLIVFVSFFGSRVHRPRCIGIGAMIASAGVFVIALPHFLSAPYKHSNFMNSTKNNSSEICQTKDLLNSDWPHQNCSQQDTIVHEDVFPILLLGQLLLGVGGVPIQPFGISYIDDFASRRNSPFYLGILFAVTVIGPAFGFILSALMLRFNVDIDKLSHDDIRIDRDDPRWIGAWWLGFLVAASFLFLSSVPYLFFPRTMPKQESTSNEHNPKLEDELKVERPKPDQMQKLTLVQFIKSFPSTMMRTLRNPIYLLVVLGQVNLAAMVAGLATFMAKFIEKQFTLTASFSNMMIGGVNIPAATLGIMTGGLIMRRLSLSVRGSALMCTVSVLVCIMFAVPLLFIGCPTQPIAGLNLSKQKDSSDCSVQCSCSDEAFNPVCGSNGVEFRSPCHAGCRTAIFDDNGRNINYTDCGCIGMQNTPSSAAPGDCGSNCTHRLLPFMVLSSLTCAIASLSQTPSFMMILRTVTPEYKSFALGVQFMLFRVLAFLPAPVLYGKAIDTTCILWGEKCGKAMACQYYDLDTFRHRFLGLQIFFLVGGMVCFFLSFIVLNKTASEQLHINQPKSSIEREDDKGNELSNQLLCEQSDIHHNLKTKE
ncbi:solute carrier organic anion transporter family member 2B1 [Clupea harengus]|uniref:Solute carrier organic anion transporter family member n=1 Tax=Clupea harengus TaxID=7950 RepID=A0A6P3VKZ3_CLUHA|nr:solute carrier organic anion transporter family member 2B1 [Clupea harengus]